MGNRLLAIILLCLVFIGGVIPISIEAQTKTDSLSALIKNTSNEDKKMELLLERAVTYERKDSLKALNDLSIATKHFATVKNNRAIVKCYLAKGKVYFKLKKYTNTVYYDSLAILLAEKIKDKDAAAMAYGELGLAQFLKGDLQQSKKSLEHSVTLEKQLDVDRPGSLAERYSLLATIESRLGQFVSSFNYFDKAVGLASLEKNKRPLIRIYANYANAYDQISDYDQAMQWHLKAVNLAEQYKDSVWLVREYNNMGIVYKHLKEYNNALKYYNLSYQISIRNNNYNNMGFVLMNMALVKVAQGEYSLIDSLNIKAIKNFKLSNNIRGLVQVYHNYGNFLIEVKRYKEAQTYLQKAMAFEARTGSTLELAHTYSVLGKLNIAEKKYDSAVLYLNKAKAIYDKIGASKSYWHDLYLYFKELYVSQNNYKDAYAYLQKQTEEEAKMYDESEKVNALKLKTEYDLKKRDAILKIEKDNQHRRQFYILTVSAAVFLILGFLLILLLQRRKQAKDRYHASLLSLQQENKIALAGALKQSEQEERSKIARKLHDETGALLSIAKLNVSQLQKEVFVAGSDAEKKLSTTKKLLSEVSDSVRNISHSLMPIALEKYGLKAALQDLILAINTSGELKVEEVLEGLGNTNSWEKELCLTIYRTVQEVLNNVIRHAKASHVLVQVVELETSVSIYIEDDGQGLEKKEGQADGVGLTLLKKSIEYLNGRVEINGLKNKGTIVLAELPIVQIRNKM